MAQKGDHPDQHVMPGIERVPPSPAVVESTLRTIGVTAANDTAKKMMQHGLALMPVPAGTKRQSSKINGAGAMTPTPSDRLSPGADGHGAYVREAVVDAALFRTQHWSFVSLKGHSFAAYFGPRPFRALFFDRAMGVGGPLLKIVAITVTFLATPGAANHGEPAVPPSQIQTGSGEPEEPKRQRPAGKQKKEPGFFTNLWQCATEDGGASEAAKACARLTR